MQLFLDTADIDIIRKLNATGLVDGITTNPSILAKTGRGLDLIPEIADIINGPISVEVLSNEANEIIQEGKKISKIAPHIVVKLPLTFSGLIACRALVAEGIRTNVTLCFSLTQALLAAKAGATYISPFIGRLEDNHENGISLIKSIRQVFNNYAFKTYILGASVRTTQHVINCAYLGADAVTLPPRIFSHMIHHALTIEGIKQFYDDWTDAKIKQESI